MKRLSVVLVFLVLLCVFGCGDKGDKASEQSETSTPVTLVTESETSIDSETEGEVVSSAQTEESDTEGDKELYNNYVKESLIPVFLENNSHVKAESVATEFIFEDFDNDKTYELFINIFDSESRAVRGYNQTTYLLDIENSAVIVQAQASQSGGSIGGENLRIYKESEDSPYVLEKVSVVRAGYADQSGTREYYELCKDGPVLIMTAEAETRSFAVYGDSLEDEIRKETNIYTKEEDCITTYILDGEYVSEDDYMKGNMQIEDRVLFDETKGDAELPLP